MFRNVHALIRTASTAMCIVPWFILPLLLATSVRGDPVASVVGRVGNAVFAFLPRVCSSRRLRLLRVLTEKPDLQAHKDVQESWREDQRGRGGIVSPLELFP